MSKEECLIYQKALITSMKKEISKLQQNIGELESELQHNKYLISDLFAKNLKKRIADLEMQNQSLLHQLEQPKLSSDEKKQLSDCRKRNKDLQNKNNELATKLSKR